MFNSDGDGGAGERDGIDGCGSEGAAMNKAEGSEGDGESEGGDEGEGDDGANEGRCSEDGNPKESYGTVEGLLSLDDLFP